MQFLSRIFLPALAAVTALFGFSACSIVQNSSPSQFYVLSGQLPEGQQPLFTAGSPEAPALVVGVVRIAAFLDRPQVTIRRDSNAVTFDEFVRWAEPLGDGVARALRANFVSLLGTPESALPWVRADNRDFNLFVFVEDIQLRADNQLELRISFRLSDGRSGQVVKTGEHVYLAAVPKTDSRTAFFASLAQVLSAQLGEFSVDIARDAASLKAGDSAKAGAANLNATKAAGETTATQAVKPAEAASATTSTPAADTAAPSAK